MPTDPAFTAWEPPEGCDVLGPTVGGGQAPYATRIECDQHGTRWLLRGQRVCCTMAGLGLLAGECTDALLLAHNDPVPAGMDAGRRVLGLGPLGIPLRSFDGYHLDNPRDLAQLLQERVGGRAVFADASGAEVAPAHQHNPCRPKGGPTTNTSDPDLTGWRTGALPVHDPNHGPPTRAKTVRELGKSRRSDP